MRRKASAGIFWVLVFLFGFLGCLFYWDSLVQETEAQGRYDALKREYIKGEYPAPRFPSYLKKPKTVDEIMPFARAAVRQTGGRTPLGLVNPGMTMLIVTTFDDDEMILQAVKRAAEERGVKVTYAPYYELAGVDREVAYELFQITSAPSKSHDGVIEGDGFLSRWEPKEVAVNWLRERRPDLYDAVYKNYVIPEHLKKIEDALGGFAPPAVAEGIVRYLDDHPEVGAVFWGYGGRPSLLRMLKHHYKKFYGNWIMGTASSMMSRVPSYPGDVWVLSEERTIEPLSWTEEVKVFDPEGTDFSFTLTQEEAAKWFRGVYNAGHLFLMPHQSTGRFPFAVVDYPAVQEQWLSPMITKADGTFAAVSNHSGLYPRCEVELKGGYVQEVKDGGPLGQIYQEFLKNWPNFNTAQYPYYPKDAPGFFWVYEAGTGTNPKFFNYWGEPAGERNHAGVIHWGFGCELRHGPKGPIYPQEWYDWAKENKMPSGHLLHLHIKFATYQVRIRNTNKWLTLINKGRLSALDDPMVRALASRYGDPDDLLADEWVDEIPGINVPGSYAEYAKDPRGYWRGVVDKVEDGTYEYLYTPPSMREKR